jgi:urease accessory protein
MKSFIIFSIALISHISSHAHNVSGSGFIHPLIGIDHLLAMIAVGALSVQLGGRAIYMLPLSFLCAMLLGGIVGFEQYKLYYTEIGIVFSVALLGVAIGMKTRLSLVLAVVGVAIFGVCHGYAHGVEQPFTENQFSYAAGFLFTTACLHFIGAFGADLIHKRINKGSKVLQALGFATAFVGVGLMFQL